MEKEKTVQEVMQISSKTTAGGRTNMRPSAFAGRTSLPSERSRTKNEVPARDECRQGLMNQPQSVFEGRRKSLPKGGRNCRQVSEPGGAQDP